MKDESVQMRLRENLPKLLRGPFSGRVARHIAVQNPSRADLHRDEHIENPERGGDGHEEVAGDDRLGGSERTWPNVDPVFHPAAVLA